MPDHRKIDAARHFAATRHAGQADKLSVPYIHHVEDVARRVAGEGEAVEIIAWLHDTVEDTGASLDEIEHLFGPKVRAGVDAMTKRDGEDFFTAYLPRVAANPDAVKVKLADAAHNWGKAHLLRARDPKKAAELEAKYRRAIEYLGGSVEGLPQNIRFDGSRWVAIRTA
jgi:(p)ppGpp synthase/HD superfamily hydrolase